MNFRGHEFQVVSGTTHPQYSQDTFTQEEHEFREKYWHPEPGQVVVDAGASYGSYTLTALACGASVRAYEPEPSVRIDLVRNVELNGWLHRFFASSFGLWDRTALVHMSSYAPHWPKQTITGDFKMKRLDDIFDGDRLDWFKLDVEGAEERAIKGALQTIAKHKPRLIIEAHVFLDADMVSKIKALLPQYSWILEERDPCVMMIGVYRERGLV